MTNKDVGNQIKQTVESRPLHDLIESKTDNRATDERLFEELSIKVFELGDLVAVHHAEVNRLLIVEREHIRKTKAALEAYRKATRK